MAFPVCIKAVIRIYLSSSFFVSSQEEDEVDLIPLTPKGKSKEYQTAAAKASPKASKSPAVKGKSPKERNKSALVDLRKLTPLKIVKSPKHVRPVSPKKVSSAKNNSGNSDGSPKVRSQARKVAEMLDVSEKRNTRKSLNEKCDTHSKPFTEKAADEISKGFDDSLKLSRSQKSEEFLQVSQEMQKSPKHITSANNEISEMIVESSVKSIVKSPCRSMQNPASPKLVEHLVVTKSPCVKKSEFKILQNQSAVICNPDSFRKSPSVLESSQSLNEKNPPLSKRLASKSSTKHFQYTASSGKVSLKNNTKSPDKSNKLRNNTHYLSVKNNKENNEERHMRDTRSKPTVEGNGTKLEHMSVTPRRRNRLFTCTDKEQDKDGALGEEHIDDGYIRAKRSVQQKGEKPELNCDKDILCNKESRLADINFCEEFKNSMNKEVDNESRSDDDITKLSHHDAKMTTLESPDTEMEVDKPTSESDKGGNDLPTYNSLDLSALIELGAKKAANPTSSDDFERCLFKAISLGKLNHKHMPEEIQSDRVLRSKKMLDLNEAHLDGQTESATNIASEVIVGKNMDTEASVLETNKAGDGLINETNEQDESTVVLKIHTRGDNGSETHQLTEHEIKLFYQPPDNKETSEFELPLGIQQEVLFTPTLAERVKTRTRLNSVTSYSLSSPVRSRSNSVSSNNSDASAARKSNTLKANVLLNKAKHLLKQHKRAVTGSKHSDTDMSSERDLRTQKSDSVTVPVADETKTTENLDNLRDRNVKGMNSNPAVLNKLVRDDTSRIKSKKTGFKHKNSENSNKRHENRSKKANNELQGLKDYWNDLSSPTVERLRSRTKIIQYDEDSSALTDEYEYSETLAHSELSNQSDSVKYPGIHSDMIVEDAKKTYNAVSDKQTNAPNSVTNIPNLEGDFISWVVDARKDIKKHRPAIQTLESSLTKKITDEIETDMIGDRESPVFNTSPVSKRRKAKHVTKISDQRTDNKEEKESVLLPENERTTAECDIVRMKDSVKEIVSSREKGSKNQSKIRISKAIRNSFTQNFQDFCSDKEVSRPVVTSADLNSSAEIDDSKDEARLSENSVDQSIIPNTPNAKKNVPSGCYGSGYSSTPRSERRKAWKRKNVSSGQNGDHGSHSKKRRKLEKLKFVIEDEKTNFSHGPACAVSETKSPKKHRTKTQNSSGDENLLPDNKNTSDKMSSSLIDEEKNKSRGVVDTERLKIEDLKNISLKWESVSGEKNKVKLNKSWSLLSDRSVSKLLTSEDDRESFHGFTEEEIKADTSLASDMSYEECWEVDKAINSDREFEVDIVEKEPEGLNNKEDFENLVPTFSSPGKRSDSSWFDACEVYIDKSLKNTDESLSVFKGWTSPRKNSVKSPGIEDIYKSPTKSAGTAKLRKQVGSPISKTEIDRMQVDRDIQFNYKSPQKNRHQFSPLKVKNGEIIDRSSPHYKTSTPSRRIKYGKD